MKNLTITALLILLGVSFYYAYTKHREAVKLRNDREVIEKLVYKEAQIITRYVDRNGSRHVTIAVNPMAEKEADRIVNIADTAALAIGILKKQIIDLTRINTTVKAQNLTALTKIDSLNRRVYFYQDKFLKLSYRPPVDTVDSGEFDFAYNADLTVTQYSKRKHLFAPKKYLIDIYSNDPRTTVNGVRRLSIEREVQPKFRLQSALIYNVDFNTFTPGFTARFEAKRVSVSGSYLYSPVRERWFSAVGMNYDLIRF